MQSKRPGRAADWAARSVACSVSTDEEPGTRVCVQALVLQRYRALGESRMRAARPLAATAAS